MRNTAQVGVVCKKKKNNAYYNVKYLKIKLIIIIL